MQRDEERQGGKDPSKWTFRKQESRSHDVCYRKAGSRKESMGWLLAVDDVGFNVLGSRAGILGTNLGGCVTHRS